MTENAPHLPKRKPASVVRVPSDQLPEFASEKEIAVALMGERWQGEVWSRFLKRYTLASPKSTGSLAAVTRRRSGPSQTTALRSPTL
jgi:hypothetical protein